MNTMNSRAFWYGVKFKLIDIAGNALKPNAVEPFDLLRIQLLLDLAGAIQAGLDHEQKQTHPEQTETNGLTEEQKQGLMDKIKEWRAEGAPADSLHGLWDLILDAEALLAGKPTLLKGTPTEVFDLLMNDVRVKK